MIKKLSTYLIACSASIALAQDPIFNEENGLVVMEVESTATPLGNWVIVEPGNPIYVRNATGDKHFEFTGNRPATGPVDSSLTYKFRIQKAGNYNMYIRGRRRLAGEPFDRTNDCYVRMQGDFESGSAVPTSRLMRHTKLVLQGGVNNWNWTRNLDANDAHLVPPIYNFKAGEVYTMTVSGRSQRFNMDRIVLHHSDVTEAAARAVSNPESSTNAVVVPPPPAAPAVEISGELRQWHEMKISYVGPSTSETATPNPFTNYRMDVTFTHNASNESHTVPGYFAADGDAGNTGASSGNIWRVHFAPPRRGTWSYTTSFRTGNNVATADSATAGRSAGFFDQDSGTFTVRRSNKSGDDFRAQERGLLQNRGGHYLTFSSGDPWLKAGINIPENFMGYNGFDNTPPAGNNLPERTWDKHTRDWNPGDPNWDSPDRAGSDDGHGVIGAINYVAEQGSNSIYFIGMNVEGDTEDTFPTVAPFDRVHYDVSKLDQWNMAFNHANSLGIYLHFILGETENGNENYHDNGQLGNQRKLYYRMMVARFGHLLGLEWGVGEESDFGRARHIQFANFIKSVDSYDHPVSVETRGGRYHQQYDGLLGEDSYDNTALQGGPTRMFMANLIEEWRDLSAAAGTPWVVNFQEPQGIENDLSDIEQGLTRGRRDMMWPAFMSGAAGFEWYVQQDGGVTGQRDPVTRRLVGHLLDLKLDDLRELEQPMRWNGYILDFFENLPVLNMSSDHSLGRAPNGETYVLAEAGQTYAVYNDRSGRSISLDLSGVSGPFDVLWYNPRSGGDLTQGSVTRVQGGSNVSLGNAPSTRNQDWAVLVRRVDGADIPPTTILQREDFTIQEGYANGSLSDHPNWNTRKNPLVSNIRGSGFANLDGGFGDNIYTQGLPQELDKYTVTSTFRFTQPSPTSTFRPILYTGFVASDAPTDANRIELVFRRAGRAGTFRIDINGSGTGASLDESTSTTTPSAIGLDVAQGDLDSALLSLTSTLTRSSTSGEWSLSVDLFNLTSDPTSESPLISHSVPVFNHTSLFDAPNVYGIFGGGNNDGSAVVSNRRLDSFAFGGSGFIGFSAFAVNNLLATDESDDTDNDGISNLAEYAFGGDPNDASVRGALPTIKFDGAGNPYLSVLELTSPLRNINYSVQFSTDLLDPLSTGGWQALPDQGSSTFPVPGTTGFEEIRHNLPTINGTNPQMFFRVQINEGL